MKSDQHVKAKIEFDFESNAHGFLEQIVVLKMNKIKEEPMSQELLAEFKRIKLLGTSIIKS